MHSKPLQCMELCLWTNEELTKSSQAHSRKQSKRLLEFVDDNFLLQVLEGSMRRGAMLDVILTNEEGLLRNVKLRGSLGCCDCGRVEFAILRAARRVHRQLTAQDFRSRLLSLQESAS